MYFNELAKTTRVVVTQRLGIAERLQQRIGCTFAQITATNQIKSKLDFQSPSTMSLMR